MCPERLACSLSEAGTKRLHRCEEEPLEQCVSDRSREHYRAQGDVPKLLRFRVQQRTVRLTHILQSRGCVLPVMQGDIR